ncbi:hypothetical protein PVK06_023303 [Gossypium arboreum]|uniref:Uncharacterized protein n=1 Tax=Gossypium arboreum TaxID=29729 RepID=A0ABR0PAX0_GOSAR|nr:hypothetical protein PVK06_023303 [Gossypium arboreum]
MVGWVTLAKFVLIVVPSYFMQTILLHLGIVNKIEWVVRGFIRGSIAENQQISFVRWDPYCRTVADGRLGLRNLRLQNESFLLKLAIGLLNQEEDLCV